MHEQEGVEVTSSKLEQMGSFDTLLGSVSYNDTDKHTVGKMQQIRTSARVYKKMKYDLSHSNLPIDKKEKKEEPKLEDSKQEIKKTINPQWTSEEKIMFFDALNEYGKDFESIHVYISTRLKKKGVLDDAIKTKYQIRNFYYKTFHTIEHELKLQENNFIPKNVQELYALINFGEIRKKIGTVSKTNCLRLNELIHKGSTTVKVKGKGIRIKTPMCRALRRINQLDEKYDDLKLPTRVLVELHPKDMVAFLKVQSIAQNPRIKVALPLQKRLSSLIGCVTERWRTTEAILYQNAIVATNASTRGCIPDEKAIEASRRLLEPLLRLKPPIEANVELPSIDISEYFTGQSICLDAFILRKGVKLQKDEIKKEDSEVNKSPSKLDEALLSPTIDDASQVLLIEVDSFQHIAEIEDADKIDNNNVCKEIKSEDKDLLIQEIREGWTAESCGGLTIGEIYLMFGSDSRLVLEYTWDLPMLKSEEDEPKVENCVTDTLKSLLSLAQIETDKRILKCSCGHICGARNAPHFKRPVATKLLKRLHSHQEHEENEIDTTVLAESKIHELSNESCFRSSNQVTHLLTQFDIQRLNPKYRNKGKPRCKQLMVERKLVPNKSEPKAHQIVSMNIIAQENTPNLQIDKNETVSTSLELETSTISTTNFGGLLSENPSNSRMSTGISTILNENDDQWINADADFSLSSLLGHLNEPGKNNQSGDCLPSEDSQLPQDVNVQLQTMFSETSVDYTAKFADLAAKVIDRK